MASNRVARELSELIWKAGLNQQDEIIVPMWLANELLEGASQDGFLEKISELKDEATQKESQIRHLYKRIDEIKRENRLCPYCRIRDFALNIWERWRAQKCLDRSM